MGQDIYDDDIYYDVRQSVADLGEIMHLLNGHRLWERSETERKLKRSKGYTNNC